MNVTKPRPTRRTHTEDFKRSLIEACNEPGTSVAGIALANGVNANQLQRWMRERGVEPPVLSCLPACPVADVAAGFVPVQFPRNTDASIRVELRKGTEVVRVEWPASSTAACGA